MYGRKIERDKNHVFLSSKTINIESDSLVVRESASGAVGRVFAPWSRHTKGVKNGTSNSLADARIKRVVLGI